MHTAIQELLRHAGEIIVGKHIQLKLALCCLIAQGHLLIEDIPGVGKTTLAHTLARLLGMQYRRIQFTSDLLPADIIGASVFDRENHCFLFHPGPIFNQMILADEINRSPPKAQSALLEAMEEHQVTVEGETRRLPEPFFVIATQNPIQQVGTFQLPESQLDRFLMRIELGYPGHTEERTLLQGVDRRQLLDGLPVCIAPELLQQTQAQAELVHVSEALLDYLQALLAYTRESPDYPAGLSPRAGLGLLDAAKAWTWLDGRDSVLPEDVQAVLSPVAGHRLRSSLAPSASSESVVRPLLENVAVV